MLLGRGDLVVSRTICALADLAGLEEVPEIIASLTEFVTLTLITSNRMNIHSILLPIMDRQFTSSNQWLNDTIKESFDT